MGDAMISTITSLLLQTVEVDAGVRRSATQQLESGEGTAGFAISLLQIVDNNSLEEKARLLAATYFKNLVRKYWNEEEYAMISAEDRETIKANLVQLMAGVPVKSQRQLSEALAIIAKRDFPDQWQNLLPDLVIRLQTPDVNVVNGVLETANAIFERFRDAPNTDPVRAVIRLCLDTFAAPLLDTYTAVAARITQGASNREAKGVLAPYMLTLRLATSCFHSLSWLELPDVFQDHMAEWMTLFRDFITFSYEPLMAEEGDLEEGPLEALQATILDVIALYADKHDEDFEPFFATFAGDVWTLLSGSTTDRIMWSSMDVLVVKAVKFLTASVTKAIHMEFFNEAGVLEAICEKVVVPNITMRESDYELFFDNPIDFIHRDIEGSDNDTRRRVAADLVRGLLRHFQARATTALLGHINALLSTYESNRASNEVSKDAAIALLIAVTVRAQILSAGATQINEGVNIAEYLTLHILPELQAPTVDASPLVKAACIKFISTFRAQFDVEQLAALLPILIPFTAANSYVVHTYAAVAIERLLLVKDRVTGADGRTQLVPRLSIEFVASHLVSLFTALFGLMSRADYVENEYLMRTLLRVVAFVKEAVTPYAAQVIAGLGDILARVCKNPANPIYNHLMFETIAAVMKNVCTARQECVEDFEKMLFPHFEMVLNNDVSEFHPYVFQLMAELLELRAPPAPGTANLSAPFESLLGALVTSDPWQRVGNIPALTVLMQAYLRRGAAYMVAANHLVSLLTIWQSLYSTANREEHAFAILDALFEGMSAEAFGPYLVDLFNMMLEKLHTTKSKKLALGFCHSSAMLAAFHGADALHTTLESISPGLFYNCLDHIYNTQASKLIGKGARVETAIGLSRILTEVPSLLTDGTRAGSFNNLLSAIVELLEPVNHSSVGTDRAAAFFEEAETGEAEATSMEYSAAFSKLTHAQDPHRSAVTSYGDPKAFLANALVRANAAHPGVVRTLVAASPVANAVGRYIAAAGVSLA